MKISIIISGLTKVHRVLPVSAGSSGTTGLRFERTTVKAGILLFTIYVPEPG